MPPPYWAHASDPRALKRRRLSDPWRSALWAIDRRSGHPRDRADARAPSPACSRARIRASDDGRTASLRERAARRFSRGARRAQSLKRLSRREGSPHLREDMPLRADKDVDERAIIIILRVK